MRAFLTFQTASESSLTHRLGAGRQRKMDGDVEAHLIALRCSEPPKGVARWTLRLLADKMIELNYVDTISHETVRQTLKKISSNPGEKNAG